MTLITFSDQGCIIRPLSYMNERTLLLNPSTDSFCCAITPI